MKHELKVTCPGCGQHIACDSDASGREIACPTCQGRMIVPAAPSRVARRSRLPVAGLILVCISVLALAFFPWKHRFWDLKQIPLTRNADETVAVDGNRLVDEVKIADLDSETAHGLKGASKLGNPFRDKLARSAVRHGWFSYGMKVLPDRPMSLVCSYVTSDKLPHVCDILVNGQRIAQQALFDDAPVHYLDMEYEIPRSLTKGQDQVTVRFEADGDHDSGRLYTCQMLRR